MYSGVFQLPTDRSLRKLSATWMVDFCIHVPLGVFFVSLTAPNFPHQAVTPSVFDLAFTTTIKIQHTLLCNNTIKMNSFKHTVPHPHKGCTSPLAFLHLLIDLTVLNRLRSNRSAQRHQMWGVMNGLCDAAHYPAGSGSFYACQNKAALVITNAHANIQAGMSSSTQALSRERGKKPGLYNIRKT